ncbi:YlqD protein [Desulfonispora thiosulfatigenes DSM 11270]|uniref:YlqD protein n=1 Tax=Desulfonispora thiosulfatigenes DSM 11270 TaxID=656914 RepID=A0A1W1VKG1_DESTI|nr:YlqD family protein [Desulfonispora thiosulfatigenes]SMB93806.1 YlqD protein [Desulfonispora thiosulfatigenes DSM 11270]
MKELTVITKVVLKQIVTDNYKNKLILDLQNTIKNLDNEINLLSFKIKNVISDLSEQNHPRIDIVKEKLYNEQENKNVKRQEYIEKLKEISNLENKTEIVQGTINSPVTLQVGDNIDKLLTREIIIKDNVIIEIRQ